MPIYIAKLHIFASDTSPVLLFAGWQYDIIEVTLFNVSTRLRSSGFERRTEQSNYYHISISRGS